MELCLFHTTGDSIPWRSQSASNVDSQNVPVITWRGYTLCKKRDSAKPGLWTVNWTLDLIIGLEFRLPGGKLSHLNYLTAKRLLPYAFLWKQKLSTVTVLFVNQMSGCRSINMNQRSPVSRQQKYSIIAVWQHWSTHIPANCSNSAACRWLYAADKQAESL